MLPLIESGSPGIWFKEIAAKCGIPKLVSKPFIFKTSLHAFLSLSISKLISCFWKSPAILADFILDKEAQKLADEAAKSSTCIPIGEGENCW